MNNPITDRLQALQPLFQGFWPKGMRDFRGVIWPCAWRGGLFRRSTNPRACKALFGCAPDCDAAARYLNSLGIQSESVPPGRGPELECDGERIGRARINWWTLLFTIPEGFVL